MATIKLSDGREVPIVKPTIADQMMLERQMRGTRKKYGPADFMEDMKLASFNQAFGLFASFNRAGVRVTIQEVLELDLGELSKLVTLEPGDAPDDDEPDEAESEGEQSVDPQLAPTVAVAAPVL